MDRPNHGSSEALSLSCPPARSNALRSRTAGEHWRPKLTSGNKILFFPVASPVYPASDAALAFVVRVPMRFLWLWARTIIIQCSSRLQFTLADVVTWHGNQSGLRQLVLGAPRRLAGGRTGLKRAIGNFVDRNSVLSLR